MKISVITVCYNSGKTIGHTLRSVREQTHADIEHIIVDGQSSDNTLAIVQQEGAHVAKIVSERDAGIYDAMNKGIALSSGEVIAFINADDFYAAPDVLATVAAEFDRTHADSCHGDLCYVNPLHPEQTVRYWRSSRFVPGSFERAWCPPHPAFFVRRSIYLRLGGFDPAFRFAADFELMARFLGVARISNSYIPKVLVSMRLGGTTNRNIITIFKQNLEIRRALKQLGLESSLLNFVFFKLRSRILQFLKRPG